MEKDVVVVCGVGAVGRAVARRVGSGRRLLLADVDETALDATADVLSAEGHDVTTQATDVSVPDAVDALVTSADSLGFVTHLVHAAGTSPSTATVEEILRADLLGAALVLEAFADVVVPRGAGVIVAGMDAHLCSLDRDEETALGTTPSGDLLALPFLAAQALGDPHVAFAVAKRASVLRVRSAALSWAVHAARVNSVSPGFIGGPAADRRTIAAGRRHRRTRAATGIAAAPVPVAEAPAVGVAAVDRPGTPEDIAAAAAFLLDPSSRFITGTDLLVDGGVLPAMTRSGAP